MATKPYQKPHLIALGRIGDPSMGFISVLEHFPNTFVPFEVKRLYWTYCTPGDILRGKHAHKETEQVLIAVSGSITVHTESAQGELLEFCLEAPDTGLYLPPNSWHTMRYSTGAVQLVLANTTYEESDYFRNKSDFTAYWLDRQ